MKNFIFTAKCLAFSAIVSLGACLTAAAQFSPVGPDVCMTHTVSPLTTTNYSYTLAAGQTFIRWEVAGQISIPNSTGTVSGSTRTIAVTSTGFGRGLLTLVTSASGCATEGRVSLNIKKSFAQNTAPVTLTGPACVQPGATYGYILSPPIVSTAPQIAAGLADTYVWDLPSGATATYSGDGSAALVTMPSTIAPGSTVGVTIGSCNSTADRVTTPLVVKPLAPLLVLTSGDATCKTTLAPFTISYDVVAGTKYTWNSVPAGWILSLPGSTVAGSGVTYTSSGTKTATITIQPGSALAGDITVTANVGGSAGDCYNSTSVPFPVSQQLNSTAFPITMTSGGAVIPAGTCITPGTVVTFSVNSASLPANTVFNWSVPTTTGWSSTPSTSNSITVTVGAANGTVTARLAGCGTGGSSASVKVSGTTVTPTGGGADITCTYTLTDLSCGLYRAARATPLPLVTDCTPEQYYFTVIAPDGVTIVTSSPANTTSPLNNTSANFQSGVPIPAGSTVRVVGTKRSNCLRMTKDLTNVDEYDPTICRGMGNPGNNGGTASSGLGEQVVVYPNPTGNFLQIDLPVRKAGQSQLTLVDALGRVMLTTTTAESRTKLDVRHLPAGIYTLRTKVAGGKEQAQSVVVQH